MNRQHSSAIGNEKWDRRQGTPLHALPGFTALSVGDICSSSSSESCALERPRFFLEPGGGTAACGDLESDEGWSPVVMRRHSDDRQTASSSMDNSGDVDSNVTSEEDLYQTHSSASSTGELVRSISQCVSLHQQQSTRSKKSLDRTPSFTYVDAKAMAAAKRNQGTTYCASKSVLKIMLTFCLSFLLGMIITVVYIELYTWRHRS